MRLTPAHNVRHLVLGSIVAAALCVLSAAAAGCAPQATAAARGTSLTTTASTQAAPQTGLFDGSAVHEHKRNHLLAVDVRISIPAAEDRLGAFAGVLARFASFASDDQFVLHSHEMPIYHLWLLPTVHVQRIQNILNYKIYLSLLHYA